MDAVKRMHSYCENMRLDLRPASSSNGETAGKNHISKQAKHLVCVCVRVNVCVCEREKEKGCACFWEKLCVCVCGCGSGWVDGWVGGCGGGFPPVLPSSFENDGMLNAEPGEKDGLHLGPKSQHPENPSAMIRIQIISASLSI